MKNGGIRHVFAMIIMILVLVASKCQQHGTMGVLPQRKNARKKGGEKITFGEGSGKQGHGGHMYGSRLARFVLVGAVEGSMHM